MDKTIDDESMTVYMNSMRSRDDCRNYARINTHQDDYFHEIKRGQAASMELNEAKHNGINLPFVKRRELRLAINKGRAAREAIINANLRLVPAIAKRYKNNGVSLIDLVQDGNAALVHACDLYDPDHVNPNGQRTKFSTYATQWIIQAIGRSVKNNGRSVRLPVHARTALRKIQVESQNFELDNHRKPTIDEISEMTGFTIDKIRELMEYDRQTTAVSLDMKIGTGDERDTTLGELVMDKDDGSVSAFDESAHNELSDKINEYMSSLSERERDIIRKMYGFDGNEPMNMDEIAKQYKLTRERIRQISIIAKRKLMTSISDEYDELTLDEMK